MRFVERFWLIDCGRQRWRHTRRGKVGCGQLERALQHHLDLRASFDIHIVPR